MSLAPLFQPRTISITGTQVPLSVAFDALRGTESINGLFEYSITLKTRDEYATTLLGDVIGSNWSLQSLIGSSMTVHVQQDGKVDLSDLGFGVDIGRMVGGVVPAALGAGVRHINGIVSRAAYAGVVGRHASYTVTLRPWLWLLGKTSDYRVFQHASVIDIIDTVLKKYPFVFETRYSQSYPMLDFQVQYGETDLDFVTRLMQEYGINYHFEHTDGQHTLVLSDSLAAFKPMDSVAYQTLFVYPPDLKIGEEYVHRFNPMQRHTTGQIRLTDYQFKQPTADQAIWANQPWETAHNQLEQYEFRQGDYVSASDGGDFKARVYMESLRQFGRRASGAGNLRGVQVGHTFYLANHPNLGSNRGWVVLGTDYIMREVAGESGQTTFEVSVEFTVQPDNELVRPIRSLAKPRAPIQTAVVVGPAGQEVWTDQYARVKVQFHWDRLGALDENSSCWVRVSSPWAGSNYGGIQIPRIGQEVVISFMNDDPDYPFISGRLTNPVEMPLWTLPSQYVLSGFKSKEIDAGRNNHLIMDDTTGEIQVQLTSDHQLSQLNLGYVTRVPDVSGRADYRGQGFELRTDGHGVIRAAMGMMLSTYTRATGAAHIKDASEIIGTLKGAVSAQKSHNELSIDHKADDRTMDETAHEDLKAQSDAVATGGSDAFPELGEAQLIVGSPAGIALATPKSTHVVANKHIALTSSQDTSLAIGGRWAANVARGIKLFSVSKGIKLFAAKGKVEIQAQSDNMDIIAEKVVKFISAKERIEIAAKEEILLTAKGSYIKINAAGIEHGSPSPWVAHAASHAYSGPKELPFEMPAIVCKDCLKRAMQGGSSVATK